MLPRLSTASSSEQVIQWAPLGFRGCRRGRELGEAPCSCAWDFWWDLHRERALPWLCSAFLGPGCCGRSSARKRSRACDHGGGDGGGHPPGRSPLYGKISRPPSRSPNFGSSFLVLETPLSLSQLCRVTVRKAAGQRALEKIAKLNIPPRLIQYLSYN